MPKAPHPLIRLALFGGLYFCGTTGLQSAALVALPGANDLAAGAESFADDLLAGRIPAGFLIAAAWINFTAALGLTLAFRAWAREDALAGMRFGGRAGREIAAGLALGLASLGLAGLAYYLAGWADFVVAPEGSAALLTLVLSAVALLPAAAAEEVVFRGYVLETIEQWRGRNVPHGSGGRNVPHGSGGRNVPHATGGRNVPHGSGGRPLALAVSSVTFGLAHATNPDVSAIALANIALAGLAFGLAYSLTRSLWLPIAYHFAWNYAQGPLLGLPVSGLPLPGVLQATVTGPALWTGGAFGPEGGLAVTAVLVMTCGGLWVYGRG